MTACLCLSLSMLTTAHACNDAATLDALNKLESNKLLQNAPTFRHAWEDKNIQLSFTDAKSTAQGCVATMQLTLPQQDLNEVNAYLDENPAKRILLGAQGYTVPDNTVSKVDYFYTLNYGQVNSANDGNQALNNLHSNIEFMYQSLAQERIVLKPGVSNTVVWNEQDKNSEQKNCIANYKANSGELASACSCRTDNLSKKLSPRQMELVAFIQKQPYSAATGVLNSYKQTSKEINETCNLAIK